uniref:Uncharacterized protein n=1 Tax=Oryza sativa subsp. japonica TaxID=39947 RepID=Q84ZC5_ORYSJ|nr:hypothetical protein [Oryza sativa Japonica Group]
MNWSVSESVPACVHRRGKLHLVSNDSCHGGGKLLRFLLESKKWNSWIAKASMSFWFNTTIQDLESRNNQLNVVTFNMQHKEEIREADWQNGIFLKPNEAANSAMVYQSSSSPAISASAVRFLHDTDTWHEAAINKEEASHMIIGQLP